MDQASDEKLRSIVRVNQLIVGGLISSVVFLTIMLVVMGQSDAVDREDDANETPIIALAAAGVAAMSAVGRLVVGQMGTVKDDGGKTLPSSGIGSDIDDPLVRRVASNWMTGNIVRNAITEAAAIFNAVAYMVDGQLWSIGIVGILVAWMAVSIPTLGQLQQRIEERRLDVPPEPLL